MQLWTDDLEALRGETRAAVDETLPTILELMGRTDDSGPAGGMLDRDAEVAKARTAMEAIYLPSPEADLREIAGVPCRVMTLAALPV